MELFECPDIYIFALSNIYKSGPSLGVQWLRLRVPNAGGPGSIPGWGTKILHAAWPKQKQKQNNSLGLNIVILMEAT